MTDMPYWIALGQLPRWTHARVNSLVIRLYHDRKMTIEEFFQLDEISWRSEFELNEKEVNDLKMARADLSNYAFLAESMQSQGYELIPIISPEYPKMLKENLKATHAPTVCYVKGNKKIFKESTVAIVGSRIASDVSLQFTDHIAKKASAEYKVVVSGFAKGVDKQALDSALKYKGQSIIVLPQGIMTFGSGYKTYYKQIVEGDLLVLSTFFPKAPWMVELAMARNPIIYGLAKEIFVAESSDKGGTWSGVLDGLRKGRQIFVRKPGNGERCANNLLISKGAIAVDMEGMPVSKEYITENQKPELSLVEEPGQDLTVQLLKLVANRPMTSKEIITALDLKLTSQKLVSLLKSMNGIESIRVKKNTFFKVKRENEAKQGALTLI